MARQINFERYNPFRRPDWRWERVLQMVDRGDGQAAGRSTRRDDDYVRGLRNFILRYRAGDASARNSLAYENGGLYFAYMLHDRAVDEPKTPTLIEARILAGQTDEEIAHEACTVPEAIHWYESLFFNVRDRLHAQDWITTHVLLPAWAKERETWATGSDDNINPGPMPIANPFFDGQLKFFAYFGKAYLLDYAITGFQRGVAPTDRDGVGEWLDNHYKNRIKHRSAMAAQTFEVNRYNVMQLFEINNQILTIQKNTDDAAVADNQIIKAVGGMMRDMSFAVGKEGEDLVAGSKVAEYDVGASELRDDEMILLSAGQNPGTIEMLDKLPAPKRKNGQEDQVHATNT